MKPSYFFIIIMICIVPACQARPDIYMNPYAYQVPWLQQGVPEYNEQGDCMGASSAYALELIRAKADGRQPTYNDPPITRNQWVNTSNFSMVVDVKPANSFSVNSIFQRVKTITPSLENMEAIGTVLMSGVNYESDYYTPKNFLTKYYYPQNQGYLDQNRVWKINEYQNITESTPAATWERIKENVYTNGVAIIEFRTYSTTISSLAPGTVNFREPSGSSSSEHAMAAVGYNQTTEVVYVMNSWGPSMWGNSRPKIIGITKTYWEIGGLRAYVPRR
jgi:hypothetical protein